MAAPLRSFASFLLEFVHCLPSSFLSAIGQNYYQKGVHCHDASSLPTIVKELNRKNLLLGLKDEDWGRVLAHLKVNELNRKNLLLGLNYKDWARVLAHLARRRGTSSLEATVSIGPWHHC
ncbi:hypothetical protein RHMOL_Rhmol12G0111900 [Rhododendron molle]|uniref:Uncharacterized protein n=1 Tax=Rhododendron molle TaxID=49168 RepID=A0ACC0LGP6_RHOML|nr:hypothetical protein RHMOL_Rhmol12G0111900 [Rhododendron molle]